MNDFTVWNGGVYFSCDGVGCMIELDNPLGDENDRPELQRRMVDIRIRSRIDPLTEKLQDQCHFHLEAISTLVKDTQRLSSPGCQFDEHVLRLVAFHDAIEKRTSFHLQEIIKLWKQDKTSAKGGEKVADMLGFVILSEVGYFFIIYYWMYLSYSYLIHFVFLLLA